MIKINFLVKLGSDLFYLLKSVGITTDRGRISLNFERSSDSPKNSQDLKNNRSGLFLT